MAKPKHAAAESGAQGATAQVDVPRLHRDLLAWYAACRRDLPWRRTRDPYAIWVSEVMLQQTRVETVVPYYHRFLARFPTPEVLADAAVDDVLALWSGLGYYRRARLLHEGARAIRAAGAMPADRGGLLGIPGIGVYTAGAVASIAWGEPVGVVDGNVARVLARIFSIAEDMRGAGLRRARALADAIVARDAPGAWNQALMELGATVCTPVKPACAACPVRSSCTAHASGRVAELPVLAAKKKPVARRLQALVATCGDAVLLVRRDGDGLFGSLWEPPCADGGAAARHALVERFGARAARPSGRVTHTLSHRRLTVHVARALATPSALDAPLPPGYSEARLVLRGALTTLGVSTLARKILACGGWYRESAWRTEDTFPTRETAAST